jgi:AcrR family transcriptional regulator
MVRTTSKAQREDSDVRRQFILDAAQDLIYEAGLEGFRVREVAERSGMHHASMMHYFPNREALLRGVVERIVASLDRVPTTDARGFIGSPRDLLHTHFQHVLHQMHAFPKRFVVLNELFLRAMRDEEVRQILSATDASWHQFLIPLITFGVAQGGFRADLHPEATATIITSFFKGLSTQLNLAPDQLQHAVAQLEQWITGTAPTSDARG